MAPTITPVTTSGAFPSATTVVIIGGGIVGLTAALTLSERQIPVVVLEKGRIAGEQSSRNLGWVRKTSRLAEDIPLALASDRLWAGMAARTGRDVGYRQAGIMFNARSEVQMAMYEGWLQSVRHLQLDSRLLSREEIARHVPGGSEKWAGGFYPFGRPGGTDAGLKRNSPRGDGTGGRYRGELRGAHVEYRGGPGQRRDHRTRRDPL
jgi:choline dehydrogenase-like flavoprotein